MVTMKKTPLVSVVMPVFNAETYLAKALDSILNQTYENLQIIIINDGSSDGSMEVVARVKDGRIRVFHNDGNVGLGYSLNRGIEESGGEYVAIMHADDFAVKDRIGLQVRFLESHSDVGICGGQIIKILNNRRHLFRYPLQHEEIFATMLFYAGFAHPTVMSRRSLYRDYDLKYRNDCNSVEDYEMWTRLLRITRGANLPAVLLEYTCHEAQISVKKYNKMRDYKLPIQKKLLEDIGMSPTDDECLMHARCSVTHDVLSEMDVSAADDWFRRLYDANKKTRLFSEDALKTVLQRRWAGLCGQRDPMNLIAYKQYIGGAMSAPLSTMSAKLFVRSLIGRSYT